MRKTLIAASALLLLIAANAQAATTYTVNLTGFPDDGIAYDNYISAEVLVSLDDSNSVLTLSVKNTSSLTSDLTALAFSLPDGVKLTVSSMPTGWDYSDSVKFNTGGGLGDYGTMLDAAALTGSTFKGGDTDAGIARGAEATFGFIVSSLPGADLPGLVASQFDLFVARFQGVIIPGESEEGSAVATPTPIPGAAWLLGAGLVGLVGLRRFHA